MSAALQSLRLHGTDGTECALRVGPGALGCLGELWQPAWSEAGVIGDAQVLALYGDAVAAQLRGRVSSLLLLDFPPGEQHKTRATKEALEDRLLAAGLGRRACIVGLGGGISLDVAGFVAATYLRGVPHVNVPTSLLAQLDAAVGGKTGVNTPHGKNLIGAFQQPRVVLIDSDLLRTLPLEEWGNGLAELVKYGVIADAELFAAIEARAADLATGAGLDAKLARRCLELKAAVVQADEREQGLRAVLNFGHTVGHAIELALEHRLSHGRAVAVGMVVEARVAHALLGFPASEGERLVHLLSRLGLPVTVPGLTFDELLPALARDKKRLPGELRLALPLGLGRMATSSDGAATVAAPLELLRRAWEAGS